MFLLLLIVLLDYVFPIIIRMLSFNIKNEDEKKEKKIEKKKGERFLRFLYDSISFEFT